jgi:hypothetical protein
MPPKTDRKKKLVAYHEADHAVAAVGLLIWIRLWQAWCWNELGRGKNRMFTRAAECSGFCAYTP